MPEPPAWTSTVSPDTSLALSNSMCSTVEKAIGAQAASRNDTPAGTGITRRAGRLRRSRAKPSRWKPIRPPTFSHRLSRPSRQALHTPHVSAPYITTRSPGVKPETCGPTAAISPEASAPMTSGSLRLANAMPRKPQRSMWLSATALTRICTSPAAGRRGAGSTSSSLRSATRVSARIAGPIRLGSAAITSVTFWPPKPNEFEIACATRASRATFGTTSSGIAGSGT